MAGSAINLTGMIAQMNDAIGRSGQDVGQGLFGPMVKQQQIEAENQAALERQSALLKQQEQMKIKAANRLAGGVKAVSDIDARIAQGDLTPDQVSQLEQARDLIKADPGVQKAITAQEEAATRQATAEANAKALREKALQQQAYRQLLQGAKAEDIQAPSDVVAGAQERYLEYVKKMEELQEVRMRNTPVEKIEPEYQKMYEDKIKEMGIPHANAWLATTRDNAFKRDQESQDAAELSYYKATGAEKVHMLMLQSNTEGWLDVRRDAQEYYKEAEPEEQEIFRKAAEKQYNELRPALGEEEAMQRALNYASSLLGWGVVKAGESSGTNNDDSLEKLRREAEELKAILEG